MTGAHDTVLDYADGQGDGSPRHVQNRRRRTRENLRVCKHLLVGVAHAGGEGRINVLPWYRPVGVQNLQLDARRKNGAARKGKWSTRGTGMTVPPILERAQETGEAGENGQYSGETGGSSPWTRPSAECGDTLKALAGFGSIWGGDRPRRRLRGRYRLGHRPVVLLLTETAQCTVRPTKGQERAAAPQLERSRP